MFMNGWGTLTGEASYTLGGLAHSNNPDVKLGAFNRIEYKNDEVDQLAPDQGPQMMDPDERRATYEDAMARVDGGQGLYLTCSTSDSLGCQGGDAGFHSAI